MFAGRPQKPDSTRSSALGKCDSHVMWAFLGRDGSDVICAQQTDLRNTRNLLCLFSRVDALYDVFFAHACLCRLFLELSEAIGSLLDGSRHELLLRQILECAPGDVTNFTGNLLDRSGREFIGFLPGFCQNTGRGHLLVAFGERVDLLTFAVVNYRIR